MGSREIHDTIPSTQDRAIELARGGARPGSRVVARHQTLGRGRLDRSWTSPPGGLYCSVVLPRPAERPGLLPLTVGARLAASLHERYAVPTVLKWPNDILVRKAGRPVRKLAGILCDDVPSPTLGRAVVIGMGVNVCLDRDALPTRLLGRVASLDEFAARPPGLEEVEAVAVEAAMGAAQWLSTTGGVQMARRLCRKWLYGVGRPVTVDGQPAGILASLGDEGELWVATDSNQVAIWAGDVQVEESA